MHLVDTERIHRFGIMVANMRRVQLMLLLQICIGMIISALAVRSLDEEALIRNPITERKEVYENGKIYDITHLITPEMPKWGSESGMGKVVTIIESIPNGDDAYVSEMKLPSHTGTHVDAPSHFFEEYYEQGYDTSTLDLKTLNGPALLVDVPRDSNITAKVMESLLIPKGIRRVLFRTLNTDRQLMYKTKFDPSFVGILKDGAEWIVKNTDIKLVGIDYLSIATPGDAVPTHKTLLRSKEIVVVEGLKLDGIEEGIYYLHCLPIKVLGAEGTPTRCILMK